MKLKQSGLKARENSAQWQAYFVVLRHCEHREAIYNTIDCFSLWLRNDDIKLVFLSFFLLLVSSCSTTKYISDDQYLLDKVSLEMEDKGANRAQLIPFVQQMPNDPKLGLKIHNMVKNDSNFIKKFVRRIGEPPVIFSHSLVSLSERELAMELKNLGYLNAQVTSTVDTINKKAEVTYHILNNEPYRIRNYTLDIPALRNRTGNRDRRTGNNRNREGRSQIREGELFNMNILERERTRVNNLLRNQGYYASTKHNLHYLADTTLRSNQVDLSLVLLDSTLMRPYTIERVNVYSGYDPLNREDYRIVDSVVHRGIHIYYNDQHYLRPSVISGKVLVRPGELFRERRSESTYSLFQTLSGLNRVDLQYVEGNYPDSTLLDCNIYLTSGNIHSLQTGIEGTNKAGDLGLAVDVNYGHLNLFNGSEIFNVNFRAAYELVSGSSTANDLNHNYYEFGIKPSITFPKFHLPFIRIQDRFNTQTQYSLGYDIQRRPEYIRNFFNFNWRVRWFGQRQAVTHTLSLLDINYVNMPWKSENFQDYLTNRVDSLTKYSYNNVFTAGVNYRLIYTNANEGRLRQHLYTIRFNAESSGNTLSWLFDASRAEKNDNGQYMIFGNPFAQYVKGDLDLAQAIRLDSRNALAFRIGLGIAYPYGNSTILPFEKRYYAGGPNNVRGWNTRHLGPGSFNRGSASDPTTHVGDINLIMNVEFRFKALSWLEPAFFVDAGNIWTIKDYPNQPGGYFQWDQFYKELAVGTGVGLRFDLSFLILRLDAGTKVYNPAMLEGERFVLFKERFFGNSAAYIAIGYPF